MVYPGAEQSKISVPSAKLSISPAQDVHSSASMSQKNSCSHKYVNRKIRTTKSRKSISQLTVHLLSPRLGRQRSTLRLLVRNILWDRQYCRVHHLGGHFRTAARVNAFFWRHRLRKMTHNLFNGLWQIHPCPRLHTPHITTADHYYNCVRRIPRSETCAARCV